MNRKEMKAYDLFKGEYVVYVDHQQSLVIVAERGGWGRAYTQSFMELQTLATKWRVIFDPAGVELAIADMGARLILSEYFVSRNLPPDQFLKVPDVLSNEEKNAIKAFELVVESYGAGFVALSMSYAARKALRGAL